MECPTFVSHRLHKLKLRILQHKIKKIQKIPYNPHEDQKIVLQCVHCIIQVDRIGDTEQFVDHFPQLY